MKVVINKCFGGFGLSDKAYEQLIAWGVPCRKYIKQGKGPDGLFLPEPLNDGEVIFDRELTPPGDDAFSDLYWKFRGTASQPRYWDSWTDSARSHPLIVRVVEELGEAANGYCAELAIVEIPDGIEWHIEEYDGREHIAENHRTWQ